MPQMEKTMSVVLNCRRTSRNHLQRASSSQHVLRKDIMNSILLDHGLAKPSEIKKSKEPAKLPYLSFWTGQVKTMVKEPVQNEN